MAQDKDKPEAAADAPEGQPLFAALRAKAGPAEPPKPAAEPPPRRDPVLDSRLESIEKKLSEAAEKDAARRADSEVLSYLKGKIEDLESRLADSQEKALAFAYELKGREEARKESQRETEALLAAVRKSQSEAEAERAAAADRERARERIEALEKRILELTAPKPPEPPPGPDPEILARLEALGRGLEELAAKAHAGAAAAAAGLEAVNRTLAENGAKAHDEAIAAAARIEAFSRELAEMERRIKEAVGKTVLEKLHEGALKVDAAVAGVMDNAEDAGRRAAEAEAKKALRGIEDSVAGRVESAIADLGKSLAEAVHRSAPPQQHHPVSAGQQLPRGYGLGFLESSLDCMEEALVSALRTLSKNGPADRTAALGDLTLRLETFRHLRAEIMKNLAK